MSSGTLAVIGLFGALWAVVQFWLKNHFDQLNNRRKAGILFLTKLNQCSAQLQYGIKSDSDCVCFESYSSFAINLSFKQAETLRKCWDDYLRCRSEVELNKEELLQCLECLEWNVQENTEPFSLGLSHFRHKLQILANGIFGSTNCPGCLGEQNQDIENVSDKENT